MDIGPARPATRGAVQAAGLRKPALASRFPRGCPEPMAKKSRKHGPEAEALSTGDLIVAVLCSGIGIIAGIVWMVQGKPKGMKMVGLSVVMVVPQIAF